MARTDLVGLLTGIGPSPIDPTTAMTPRQAALQRGAQYGQGFRRGVGALTGADTRTTGDLTQEAIQGLDFTKPEDLKVYAQIQLSTGDTAGAAQTATRIQALKQAEIEETRARAREKREEAMASQREASAIRAQESHEFGKIDRMSENKRRELREARDSESFAMQVAATQKSLSDEEEKKAQLGILRSVYANDARSRGRVQLADRILAGLPMETANRLLYSTSNAVVQPVTKSEKKAFETVLGTKYMQELIPKSFQESFEWKGFWPQFEWGKTTDAMDDAIFLKTKEISQREKIGIEEAMEQAIKLLADLRGGFNPNESPEGGNKPAEETEEKDAFATLKRKP